MILYYTMFTTRYFWQFAKWLLLFFFRFVFVFVGSASFGCGQFHGQTGHKWTDPRDGQQLYCYSHHAIPEYWRRRGGIWHTKSGQSLLSYQVSYIYTRKQNVYGVSKRTKPRSFEQAIHSYILRTRAEALLLLPPLLDSKSSTFTVFYVLHHK